MNVNYNIFPVFILSWPFDHDRIMTTIHFVKISLMELNTKYLDNVDILLIKSLF